MRIAVLSLLTFFGLAAAARANVLTVIGADSLQPNTPNQQITILLSGSDFYQEMQLHMSINSGVGPGPVFTSVFGDTSGAIPTANLSGSIWANGLGSVDDLIPPSGHPAPLTAGAIFYSHGPLTSINDQGISAVFTISTVGVPVGAYYLSLEGTIMYNGVEEPSGDPFIVPLTLPPPILLGFVVPEPSTYALAALGVAALLAVKRRKLAA